MKRRQVHAGTGALTLVEMMVSMAASAIILGAFLLSSLSMQKALNGSEKFAGAYSDQRRLIDYLARDLRRAVAVAATDDAGTRYDPAGSTVTIADGATLILTLPGYYQSNAKGDPNFAATLDVVGTDDRLDYGTTSGLAATVEVSFRKVFMAKERCVCFVRQEAGTDETVVRAADNLFAQVTVLAGAQSGSINAWFRSPFSTAAPLVCTYDQLLLRNPPLDFHP